MMNFNDVDQVIDAMEEIRDYIDSIYRDVNMLNIRNNPPTVQEVVNKIYDVLFC